jgi:hypothetical protein
MSLEITAKVETSTHDGYCTDEECEYNVVINKYKVNIPDQFKNYEKGQLINLNDFNWEKLLPIPDIDGDSYYCRNSPESDKNNVDKHSYKFTIIKVEVI